MTSTLDLPNAMVAALSNAGVSQRTLASISGSSQSYVNQVATGERTPSAAWIDLVSDSLSLSPEERTALHRAAARSKGYKIDLP